MDNLVEIHFDDINDKISHYTVMDFDDALPMLCQLTQAKLAGNIRVFKVTTKERVRFD